MRKFFSTIVLFVVLMSFSVSFAGEKCKDGTSCKLQAQCQVMNSQKMSQVSDQLIKLSAEMDQLVGIMLASPQLKDSPQLQTRLHTIRQHIVNMEQKLDKRKTNLLSFEYQDFYSEDYD